MFEHLPPARLLVKAPAVPAHSTQPCHQQKDCLSQPGSTQQGKPQETALDASPGSTAQARNHSTDDGGTTVSAEVRRPERVSTTEKTAAMTKDPGESPRSHQHLPMQPDLQDPGHRLSCTVDAPVFCLLTSLLPTSLKKQQPLMSRGSCFQGPEPAHPLLSPTIAGTGMWCPVAYLVVRGQPLTTLLTQPSGGLLP